MRTHQEGVGEGLFKPCTHKRIRSNYARDIKLEQCARVRVFDVNDSIRTRPMLALM